MEDDGNKVVVLDKSGDILCFSEDRKIIALPIEEVTLDNLLIFWSKDVGDLWDYFSNLSFWKSSEETKIDLNFCSFLDLYIIDHEKGEFLIG